MVLMVLWTAMLWRAAQEVKRHERERRESRERLSAMLGSITDAFMTLDSEWRYVFVNEQAQLTGLGEVGLRQIHVPGLFTRPDSYG